MQNHNSLFRHDGGVDVDDVPNNLPSAHFQGLVLKFYRSTVVIGSTRMKEVELLTSKHGDDDRALVTWKSERRLRITSTNVKAICQRRATTPVAPLDVIQQLQR